MVMTPQPLYDAVKYVKKTNKGKVIYLSPRGKTFTQSMAEKFAGIKAGPTDPARATKITTRKSPKKDLILICGRYEGIDQRVIDLLVDEEISIGDYVLTGGELPAMVMLDTISRLIKGVLGRSESHMEDSFSISLERKKEYPHYTRPAVFKKKKVPAVLLSGNHKEIGKWRKKHLK